MDINEIVKAAENDKNSHILNLTTTKIYNMKMNILNELKLSKIEKIEIMKKIKNYRYVDQMNEFKQGGYIRWIDIRNPEELILSNTAIFTDFRINDDGISIVYNKDGQGRLIKLSNKAQNHNLYNEVCLFFHTHTFV